MQNSATINTTIAQGGAISSTISTGTTIQSTIVGGAQGIQGIAGPNVVSVSTTTSMNGLLKGTGSYVSVATPGVDYVVPGTDEVTGIVIFDSSGNGWSLSVATTGNLITTATGTTGYPNTYQVTYA